MRPDIEYDEGAFLMALLKGIKHRHATSLRQALIFEMTYYEGNTNDRLSKNGKERRDHWLKWLKKQRP